MNLNLLEEAIRDINELHRKFSALFYEDLFTSRFNLKSTTVNNVLFEQKFDANFLEYIEKYHGELNNYIWIENNFIEKYEDLDARIRVKQKDSIYNKIVFYGEKNEAGKIPIQKCLNDLLGFRLVFDNLNCADSQYINLMENLKKELKLMRWHNRDVEGYKGFHIYFKNKNNLFYPWELQLWNRRDASINEKSHKEHKSKRDYFSWPQKYKEGKIEKG